MDNTLKILGTLVVAIVVSVSVGLYFGNETTTVVREVSSGAAGDTYASARIAHEGIQSGTTTPIHVTNNSGRDRIITGFRYFVEDHTGSGWGASSSTARHIKIRAATSSNDGIPSNTNYIVNGQFSTSSEPEYVASSTPGNTASAFTRRWADGDTITVWFEDNFGTATSVPSAASGVMGVEYFTD